ncbi:MAG: arabinose transporter permease [Burkholderia sp.]|nr:arabinose transporter permease [Burkholderia sp.]
MTSSLRLQRLALLATIFVLTAIEFLQSGAIAFAAAPIMGELGASPEEFGMVAVSYAAVAIILISKQRWMVERFGWRLYLQVSGTVFLAGALFCANSGTVPQFLAGRVVMAVGGAAFMTSSRLMINLIAPGPQRFTGIKMFASALFIGYAAAPWLAVQAVVHDHWGMIFIVLGVLAVVAVTLGSFALPAEPVPPAQRTGSHPGPLLVLAAGSFLCLYALQRAAYDFYDDTRPLALFVILGVIAITYFTWHQHRHQRPLLIMRNLTQTRYLTGLALFTLCYAILGANSYMLPVLMQRALGFPWEVSGNVVAAGLIAALGAYGVMVKIMQKSPAPRKFYVIGFLALVLFGWRLARLDGGANLWADVWPAIALFGIFIVFVMSTTALQAFTGVAHDELAFSHAQQVKNMAGQIGLSVGVAAAALGLQWRTSSHYANLIQRFTPGDAIYNHILGDLAARYTGELDAQASQAAMAQMGQLLSQQATMLASLDYFSAVMWFSLACALVMCFQRILK